MTTLNLSPDDVLSTTRSVRKRLDLSRPVPLELVRECLSLALQAPSGGNRQTWSWLIVTDPELRAKVGEYYARSHDAYRNLPSNLARTSDPDSARAAAARRVGSSSLYLAEHMGEVPVLVLGCIKAGESLPAANQAGLWGSLLPAAWSYMLAARSRGLGTAWTTLHLAYEKEISELLGIPADVHQGVLIPTAYSLGTDFSPAARQPLDEVLHINRW